MVPSLLWCALPLSPPPPLNHPFNPQPSSPCTSSTQNPKTQTPIPDPNPHPHPHPNHSPLNRVQGGAGQRFRLRRDHSRSLVRPYRENSRERDCETTPVRGSVRQGGLYRRIEFVARVGRAPRGPLSRCTGNSSPYTPHPYTVNHHPSALNPQPSTLNPRPSTLDPRPSTLNPQPSTLTPNPYALTSAL